MNASTPAHVSVAHQALILYKLSFYCYHAKMGFLIFPFSDASRRRKVSVGHGVPMSPASTMSVMSPAPSDISMPASPPAFPQSPPMSNSYPMVHSNMSAMSDASQQPFSPNPNGPRPTQVKVRDDILSLGFGKTLMSYITLIFEYLDDALLPP